MTLVVAYIMTVTGRGWVESLAAVRAVRPCAGPNLGFLRQLEEFENTELAEVSDTTLTSMKVTITKIKRNYSYLCSSRMYRMYLLNYLCTY